ncbi:Sm-like protein LSM7 [Sesamum angolense]|nr:Sm-like protein LSM7 [Sesamum angolense]
MSYGKYCSGAGLAEKIWAPKKSKPGQILNGPKRRKQAHWKCGPFAFKEAQFHPWELNSRSESESGKKEIRAELGHNSLLLFPFFTSTGITEATSDLSNFGSRSKLQMSGRKETVLDLAKFVDKGVQVKLTGGRQVTGTLKGYDQLLNLVLDEAIEFLRDPEDPLKTTDQTRRLGLIVCRGTAVMLVSPTDGTDEIANPFVQPDGA